MRVREVVTGHDAEGRAVIARDEQIDGVPIPGLGELAFLWGADGPATYPDAGDNPVPTHRWHPLPHSDVLAGVRRGCTRIPRRDARG